MTLRADLAVIADHVAPGSRVLDIGCGDGALMLALSQPIDGEPATCANGMTIGFKCDSPEQVKELHDAAIAAGGTSIEDPPGLRESAMGAMHLCYFRDLDGHKICGLHRAG